MKPARPAAFLVNACLRYAVLCVGLLLLMISTAGAEWDLDVQGGTSVAFDSNITNASSGEQEDVITRLNLGLGASYEGKLDTFDARANITHSMFADNTDFDNTAQDITFAYGREMSRYERLSVSNRFEHSEVIESFDDAFGAVSGRYKYYRNRARIGYEKDISKHITGRLRYANENYQVSRNDISDSNQHTFGIEADWVRSSAVSLLFVYELVSRHYDPGEDIFINLLSAGIRRVINRHLAFEGLAGISVVDIESSGTEANPYVSAALNYEFDETYSANLRLDQATRAGQSSSDAFESWRVTASLVKRLLSRFVARMSVFYGEGEFENSAVDEQLSGLRSRMEYDISEYVRAYAAYSYTNKQSSVSSREYDKNMFTLGVEFVF